jgi:hypothetical protein
MSSSYYRPAAGIRVRGTVLVVPGRGETAATYGRFGARLAYDGYNVAVTGQPGADPGSLAPYLCGLSRLLSEAAGAAGEEFADGVVQPLVLTGADLAAAALAALVARTRAAAGQPAGPGSLWWPDGLVLAGLPGYGLRSGTAASAVDSWAEELNIRSHCPVHRGVLDGDASAGRGTLADALPDELLSAAYASNAELPHLLLAGDTDPLADLGALAGLAKSLPLARLAVVGGGHHDVLNDLQHRSVAAEVVTFLEALRADLNPAITVQASTW